MVDVQQLPDEDAAIVTFSGHEGNVEIRSLYFSEIFSLKDQNVGFLEKWLFCLPKAADLVLCQQVSANWSASLTFGPAEREAQDFFLFMELFYPGLVHYTVQVTP